MAECWLVDQNSSRTCAEMWPGHEYRWCWVCESEVEGAEPDLRGVCCALAFDLGRAEWERDEATEDMFQAVADIGRAEAERDAALARAEKAERERDRAIADAERLAGALRDAIDSGSRLMEPGALTTMSRDELAARIQRARDGLTALALHEKEVGRAG